QVRMVDGFLETAGISPASAFVLLASEDGLNFTQVAQGTLTHNAVTSHSFATVQAEYLQLQLRPGPGGAIGGVAEFQALVNDGVLANDVDLGGFSLTATLATGPAHGTLSLAADGSFVYTATAGFAGADTFAYHASDAAGNTATGIVTIEVDAPPAATNDLYSV